MTTRRGFIAGLMAAGLAPKPSWADAGGPAYLSAAKLPTGSYVLCGLTIAGEIVFTLPLPQRGHAAAAHPTRPEAVAFARRPGTFALVIDCRDGTELAQLVSPKGRHFYGHGAFSRDGRLLYTTENDFEHGTGRIGIWDAANGYVRIGETASGGIGPHEIRRLPGRDTYVIANGGIDTHPDSGRAKLNIATMRPNLAYLEEDHIADMLELGPEHQKNSIRHIALSPGGDVAFGMQWEGDGPSPTLLGLHQMGGNARMMKPSPLELAALNAYVGSVAFGLGGKTVAITSPKGGVAQIYDTKSGVVLKAIVAEDVGGVSSCGDGFVITTGKGQVRRLGNDGATLTHPLYWDNHLVTITPEA